MDVTAYCPAPVHLGQRKLNAFPKHESRQSRGHPWRASLERLAMINPELSGAGHHLHVFRLFMYSSRASVTHFRCGACNTWAAHMHWDDSNSNSSKKWHYNFQGRHYNFSNTRLSNSSIARLFWNIAQPLAPLLPGVVRVVIGAEVTVHVYALVVYATTTRRMSQPSTGRWIVPYIGLAIDPIVNSFIL